MGGFKLKIPCLVQYIFLVEGAVTFGGGIALINFPLILTMDSWSLSLTKAIFTLSLQNKDRVITSRSRTTYKVWHKSMANLGKLEGTIQELGTLFAIKTASVTCRHTEWTLSLKRVHLRDASPARSNKEHLRDRFRNKTSISRRDLFSNERVV